MKPQSIKDDYNNRDCYGVLLDANNYKDRFNSVYIFEQHYKESRRLKVGDFEY